MFFYIYGDYRDLHVLTHSFPTRRSSDLQGLHARDFQAEYIPVAAIIGVDDTGVRDREFALACPCQDWNRSCDRRGNVTPAEYCRVRKPVDEIDNQQAQPAAQIGSAHV